MAAFWEMHKIILQVQKCHCLKAFRSSKPSGGFQVKGSVSLKGIILAGCFVRRDKLKTQRNVLKKLTGDQRPHSSYQVHCKESMENSVTMKFL